MSQRINPLDDPRYTKLELVRTVLDPSSYSVTPPNINNFTSVLNEVTIYMNFSVQNVTGPVKQTTGFVIYYPNLTFDSVVHCGLVPPNTVVPNLAGNFSVMTFSQWGTVLPYAQSTGAIVSVTPNLSDKFTMGRVVATQIEVKSDTTSTTTSALSGNLSMGNITDTRDLLTPDQGTAATPTLLAQTSVTKKDGIVGISIQDGGVILGASDISSQFTDLTPLVQHSTSQVSSANWTQVIPTGSTVPDINLSGPTLQPVATTFSFSDHSPADGVFQVLQCSPWGNFNTFNPGHPFSAATNTQLKTEDIPLFGMVDYDLDFTWWGQPTSSHTANYIVNWFNSVNGLGIPVYTGSRIMLRVTAYDMFLNVQADGQPGPAAYFVSEYTKEIMTWAPWTAGPYACVLKQAAAAQQGLNFGSGMASQICSSWKVMHRPNRVVNDFAVYNGTMFALSLYCDVADDDPTYIAQPMTFTVPGVSPQNGGMSCIITSRVRDLYEQGTLGCSRWIRYDNIATGQNFVVQGRSQIETLAGAAIAPYVKASSTQSHVPNHLDDLLLLSLLFNSDSGVFKRCYSGKEYMHLKQDILPRLTPDAFSSMPGVPTAAVKALAGGLFGTMVGGLASSLGASDDLAQTLGDIGDQGLMWIPEVGVPLAVANQVAGSFIGHSGGNYYDEEDARAAGTFGYSGGVYGGRRRQALQSNQHQHRHQKRYRAGGTYPFAEGL